MGCLPVFTIAVVIVALFSVAEVHAQFASRYAEKPGACSPPGIGICAIMCRSDRECPGQEKCCRTACGGTSCSKPVSQINNPLPVKPGKCPSVPSGPWVCSHTCTTDADCRGKYKCCKNRCDALACQKPEV